MLTTTAVVKIKDSLAKQIKYFSELKVVGTVMVDRERFLIVKPSIKGGN